MSRNKQSKSKKIILVVILLTMVNLVYAQDKVSIQIKTFDQQLRPYRNIEVSLNGKDFVNMGDKGVAFTSLNESELPVKVIQIRNEQLEAASWNYAKGVLEVIVRSKSYQLVRLVVKDESNNALPSMKVTFRGRKTLTATTDRNGRIELPLMLDEKLSTASQFSVDGYVAKSLV